MRRSVADQAVKHQGPSVAAAWLLHGCLVKSHCCPSTHYLTFRFLSLRSTVPSLANYLHLVFLVYHKSPVWKSLESLRKSKTSLLVKYTLLITCCLRSSSHIMNNFMLNGMLRIGARTASRPPANNSSMDSLIIIMEQHKAPKTRNNLSLSAEKRK